MQPETHLTTRPTRPTKPPGFSFLTRKCSVEERLRIRRYLQATREGLIRDLGGIENLSVQKLILIDRLISLLGVIRGIEEFFKEDILTAGGSVRASLGKNYLSFTNSARLILVNLSLERHTREETIQDLIKQFDTEKEEEERSAISAPVAQDLE